MSSPAPSPAMQPNPHEATSARPHQPFDGIRRLPVRDAQPPFDDEVAMYTATVDPRQGALTLAFALPNGLPAIPQAAPSLHVDEDERTPHLRLVPNDDASDDDAALGAGEGHGTTRKRPAREIGDDEFGPRQTPRTQLPDPKPWAGRLVQAIVEVASGVRPVSQLVRWTSADVYESVQLRLRTTPVAQRATQVELPTAIRRGSAVGSRERTGRWRRRGVRDRAARPALPRDCVAARGPRRPLAMHRAAHRLTPIRAGRVEPSSRAEGQAVYRPRTPCSHVLGGVDHVNVINTRRVTAPPALDLLGVGDPAHHRAQGAAGDLDRVVDVLGVVPLVVRQAGVVLGHPLAWRTRRPGSRARIFFISALVSSVTMRGPRV